MAPPPPWGFVNPPDMKDDDWKRFDGNPIYPLGHVVILVWRAPAGSLSSLRLYQVNMTTGYPFDPFDYILQSVVNRTEHEWRVAVKPEEQDLAKSNVFMLALYHEGESPAVGTSQYFNISSRESGSGSGTGSGGGGGPSTVSSFPGGVTSSSSTGTRGPNTATALLPSPTGDDAARATTGSPGTDAAADGALPTAAKIGLGVAIPLAVILGLLVGWLLFRRRRRTRDPPGQPPPHYYAPYQHPAAVAAMMAPDPAKPPPPPGELPLGSHVYEVNVPNYGLRYELDAPMYDRQARGGLG